MYKSLKKTNNFSELHILKTLTVIVEKSIYCLTHTQQIMLTTVTDEGDPDLPRLAKIVKSAANTCRGDSPQPLKQLVKPVARTSELSAPTQNNVAWPPAIIFVDVLHEALSLQH